MIFSFLVNLVVRLRLECVIAKLNCLKMGSCLVGKAYQVIVTRKGHTQCAERQPSLFGIYRLFTGSMLMAPFMHIQVNESMVVWYGVSTSCNWQGSLQKAILHHH